MMNNLSEAIRQGRLPKRNGDEGGDPNDVPRTRIFDEGSSVSDETYQSAGTWVRRNIKIVCCVVPQVRRNYYDHCGVCVAKPTEAIRQGRLPKRRFLDGPEADPTALLTMDEWKQVDKLVTYHYCLRSPVTQEIIRQGLVFQPQPIREEAVEVRSPMNVPTLLVGGKTTLPLPFTHCDVAVERFKDSFIPLDLTPVAAAARRVGEAVEQSVLGLPNCLGKRYGDEGGGPSVPGLLDQSSAKSPERMTPFNSPEYQPVCLVKALLTMRERLYAQSFYGPYVLVHGPSWREGMDQDYQPTVNGLTVEKRLLEVEGVTAVVETQEIQDWTLLLFQATPDVVRIVIGLEPIALEWDDKIKIMCCVVPQVRRNYYDHCGVCVAKPTEEEVKPDIVVGNET